MKRLVRVSATATAAALLAACSVSNEPGTEAGGSPAGGPSAGGTVTLVTHDSWSMPKRVIEEFESDSGYRLQVLKSGDAGQLTNKLVLTEGNPIGDVAYGVDNTFASRAVDAGVFDDYTPAQRPASAADHDVPEAAGAAALTPVDWGDVCVNVDDVWFRKHDLKPPATLDDLRDPAYRGLFVTPAASTSSPGFAFLLATIGQFGSEPDGDGWQGYWRDLMANDTLVVSGWTDAYEVDFTAGGGDGDRPVVLSYASSPPFTIPQGGTRPTTSALLSTCFRQVEYAGVLHGTDNPEGAKALVDFMLARAFQKALPNSMYVFPVDADVPLPDAWAAWAKPAPEPIDVAPTDIAEHREDWLRAWSDLTS